MKVGIMTWFQYHNYGSALQTVALSKVVKRSGHEPYVINYINNKRHVKKHCHSMGFDFVLELKNRLKNHPYHRYEEILREKKFEEFYFDELNFTKESNTYLELDRLNENLDMFICGSDQIWSPSVYDPHYFLDFVRDENTIVAYAPSVGLSKIRDENIKNRMIENTLRFRYISTRERSGSDIISALTGREVKTVLDPTLLLNCNEWKELESKLSYNAEPYLLVYMLGQNENYWLTIYNLAKRLKLSVKVIPTFFRDLKRDGCINEPVGPRDFLSLVHNAEFVCTDSYHGVLFAINYHKQFCVFKRFKSNDVNNQNSRIYNILNLLGLEERLFSGNIRNRNIDYSIVEDKIKLERQRSLEFLNDAIKKINIYKKSVTDNNCLLNGHHLCCGCGACAEVCPNNAVEIHLDKFGFQYAHLNASRCIACGKCLQICPFKNNANDNKIKYGKLYSYKDNSENVLKTSSSGGIGHRIADIVIKDGGHVFGCYFDVNEHIAKHIEVGINNRDELESLQGSKYIQSVFSHIIKDIKDHKDKNGTVIFGTPCQIAGIRNVFVDDLDVLLVDLICHGVPSYWLYTSYLNYLKNSKKIDTSKTFRTVFRYKERGWREKYIYNENENQSYCEHQNKDPFLLCFEHGFCYAKCCYECPWRDKSAADIRIGDFWGDKFRKDCLGVNMVSVLTQKGEDLINVLEKSEAGKLRLETVGDYFLNQQTINNLRPVFWEELIEELKSNIPMEKIIKEYIRPFEVRKALRRKAIKLKEVIKSNG